LIDTIDTLELKLKLKKGEVHNLYYNSGKPFQEALRGNEEDSSKHQSPSDPDMETHLFISQMPYIQQAEQPLDVPSELEVARNSEDKNARIQGIELEEPPKKKDKGLLTSTDLKCQICNKTFEKRRYLMDHLRRVHNSAVHKVAGKFLTH
jgi:hypothetical protein